MQSLTFSYQNCCHLLDTCHSVGMHPLSSTGSEIESSEHTCSFLELVAVTFTVSELDIEMLSHAFISFHLPYPVSPGSLTSIPLNSDICFDHPSSSPH